MDTETKLEADACVLEKDSVQHFLLYVWDIPACVSDHYSVWLCIGIPLTQIVFFAS